MRTTFTPAPDIADRIYEIARKSQKSLNEVVNDLIRKGLKEGSSVNESPRKYEVKGKSLGAFPGIDYENLSKFDEELQIEEWKDSNGHS
ncbi:MAG: hypothetical protein GC165_10115 [Armatimonadetes bacterium]|nr:hypothetical protein [Armatimonadota bacterium]